MSDPVSDHKQIWSNNRNESLFHLTDGGDAAADKDAADNDDDDNDADDA